MRLAALLLPLLVACGPSTGKHVLYPGVAPYTLTVDPDSRHDEVAAVVSRVVFAFHTQQHKIDAPLRFRGTPGWRFCGPVWTVGCNPEPDLVEFDVDWTAYTVGHELFHVYAAQMGNPYPGRDPGHLDPRWPEWDRWRDGQR